MLEMPNTLVSKSFVPGRGFVSASELGAGRLRAVVKPGQYTSRGPSKKTLKTKRIHDQNNNLFRQLQQGGTTERTRSGVERITYPGLKDASGLHAVAWKTGSRKGGRKLYAEDANLSTDPRMRTIRAHEEAHVSPRKRSGWRMAQVTSSPKKGMREEARADMAAGSYYRDLKPDLRRVRRLGEARRAGDTVGQNRELARPKVRAANQRLQGASQYGGAAASKDVSGRIRQKLASSPNPSRAQMYKPSTVRGYRDVQDRMARAQQRGR